MTYEERILAAIRGEAVDRLPFVPRLDLWYNGNKRKGTLPDKYKNASLRDIIEELDVGYHCNVPNFSTLEQEDDNAHVGLGIYKTLSVFYDPVVDVEYTVTHEEGKTTTVYQTPYGPLTTATYLDDKMVREGINQPIIMKPAIECLEDYRKVGYVFDHIAIRPRFSYYDRMKELVGDRGIVTGFQYEGGSPMHGILKEMSQFEHFWFDFYDNIEVMEECCDHMRPVLREMVKVMAECESPVLYCGANYDAMTTNPNLFRDYITEDLKWCSDYLHSKGKLCLTHTDGENFMLLEEYKKAEIDIADSVTPAPMTKLGLSDYREAFGRDICIFGGICAISVMEESMSDYEFEKYVDTVLTDIGDGRKIVLSVADSTPPGAKWERIEYLNKKCREFGPVK